MNFQPNFKQLYLFTTRHRDYSPLPTAMASFTVLIMCMLRKTFDQGLPQERLEVCHHFVLLLRTRSRSARSRCWLGFHPM